MCARGPTRPVPKLGVADAERQETPEDGNKQQDECDDPVVTSQAAESVEGTARPLAAIVILVAAVLLSAVVVVAIASFSHCFE